MYKYTYKPKINSLIVVHSMQIKLNTTHNKNNLIQFHIGVVTFLRGNSRIKMN